MADNKRIVVLEGLDGCGKSTQFDSITKYLESIGIDVKPISFPDYSNPSSELVKLYLHGEICSNAEDVNAYAASSFYAVDRYVSYKKYWQSDYENGTFILAARYVTSNCIYQMVKLPKSKWGNYTDWLEDYEYSKLELPKPDLVIYLDMPVDVSQKLLSERYNGDESQKDIHEKNINYLNSCREAALYTAQKQNWRIVKCSDGCKPFTREKIFADIVAVLKDNKII